MPEKGIKTVFLDRDGTMNVEVNYLHRPEDLQLIPGVPQAVRQLNEAGFCVVVVTNQAGVARGYYGEEDVKRIHQYLNEQLKAEGVTVIEIDKEACQEACMTTWDKYAAEVENGQDIIDAILAVE